MAFRMVRWAVELSLRDYFSHVPELSMKPTPFSSPRVPFPWNGSWTGDAMLTENATSFKRSTEYAGDTAVARMTPGSSRCRLVP